MFNVFSERENLMLSDVVEISTKWSNIPVTFQYERTENFK